MSIKSSYPFSASDVIDIARGRWIEMFTAQGMDKSSFSGKHERCPIHGGKDGFRFTDEGKGAWVCATCTYSKFKDGFTLIAMYSFSNDNTQAFKWVANYLGLSGKKPPTYEAQPQKVLQNKTQQEDIKIQQDEVLLAKRKGAIYHTKEILKNKCEYKQHQYFQKKGINELFLVLKENYKIRYQSFSNATGNIEDKIQTIYAGAAIILIVDIITEEIIGAQFIYPNRPPDKSKFYVIGTPIANGIHIIQGLEKSPYISVVEGYATGLSVSIATEITVIVAFDINGMKGKAERLNASFSDKNLVFFGDNDSHKGHMLGQEAAHQGAALTQGFAIISPESGDWDDYRKKHGAEATKAIISEQLKEFRPSIKISDKIVGISIYSSILLNNGVGISFFNALLNHVGKQCRCPISGEKAIINHDSIYSYTSKTIVVPLLMTLHNQSFITECRAIKTTKARVAWTNYHNTQEHLYALVYTLHGRFCADIATPEAFKRLLNKNTDNSVSLSREITVFIAYLFESKIKQARKIWELDHNKHNYYREVKQQFNGRLDWQSTINEITTGHHTLIAVQAFHGQGKTEELAYCVSRLITPVVYTTLRAKLVSQGCTVLGFYHYQDDKKTIKMAGHVNEFACCTPSFKHEINLNHVRRAKLLIIDEFSQWFADLLTNQKFIDRGLPAKLQEAMKIAISNGCKILLLDADLTTLGIKQFMRFLSLKGNETLLISAEPPKRDLTANISISTAPAHYQTYPIKLMIEDLNNELPFLVAIESANAARSLYDYLTNIFCDKHIVLLTGDRCLINKNGAKVFNKSKDYIDDINNKLLNVDALLYTGVIGTGVSIKHYNQRFTTCYGLFSGWVSSPMDAIQMIKRGRDVTKYIIGLLCRIPDLYMTSFYKDLGAQAWDKLITEPNIIDTITTEIEFSKRQNDSLFIPAFIGLLRDKHKFKITGELSIETKFEDLQSPSKLSHGDQLALMSATPHNNLHDALACQIDEYKDDEEHFSCEARICLDYYALPKVTLAAAELWCNAAKRKASERLELIVKILRDDNEPTIKDIQKKREVLIDSGITMDLFKNQRLHQNDIQELRNKIAPLCAELVRIDVLPERYVKTSKIPVKQPIDFIKTMLAYIGFDIKTIRAESRVLDIKVPEPMASRLKLDVRTDTQQIKDEAHRLKSEGQGYGQIANALGLKDKHQARRLLGK